MFLELFEYIKKSYDIHEKKSFYFFKKWKKMAKEKYPYLTISQNLSGNTLPIVPWVSVSENKKYATTIIFSVKNREPFISIQSPSDNKKVAEVKRTKKIGSILLLSKTEYKPNNLDLESVFAKTSYRPKNYEDVSIIAESLKNKNESDIEKLIDIYETISDLLNKEKPDKMFFNDEELLELEELIETGVSFSEAKARIGHNKWAKTIKDIFDNRCAICKIDFKDILVSSHIKDWKEDEIARGNINNGLLLCSLHDSLFDKKLISFDRNGQILISPLIMHLLDELNIKINTKINEKYINGTKLSIEKYMNWHRKKFNEKT